MEVCIFFDKPKHCTVCIDVGKLQCLLNHQFLAVSPAGRDELQRVLTEVIDHPKRVRAKAIIEKIETVDLSVPIPPGSKGGNNRKAAKNKLAKEGKS